MSQLTAQEMRELLSDETESVYIPILKIEHPDLTEDIKLCMNTQVLYRSDGNYMPYPFQIAMPTQGEDKVPSVQLTVDNTDLEVNQKIRELMGEPKVTLTVVLGHDPDNAIAGPFVMNLKTAHGNKDSISGTLGYESDIWAQQVPAQHYLPTNSAGLFI